MLQSRYRSGGAGHITDIGSSECRTGNCFQLSNAARFLRELQPSPRRHRRPYCGRFFRAPPRFHHESFHVTPAQARCDVARGD
jgi:hypothetical protein